MRYVYFLTKKYVLSAKQADQPLPAGKISVTAHGNKELIAIEDGYR
ncbi:MAG: hypothetical protein ACTS78_03240 [Arsenophonus sp. NC-WZS1-MAG3]